MACGLCCIANTIKGITDYIIDSGENGYLLDTLEASSIADALGDTIGNRALQERVGYEAHSKIKRVFNMDEIKTRYRELYINLLK